MNEEIKGIIQAIVLVKQRNKGKSEEEVIEKYRVKSQERV
jgi:hypothetical protein